MSSALWTSAKACLPPILPFPLRYELGEGLLDLRSGGSILIGENVSAREEKTARILAASLADELGAPFRLSRQRLPGLTLALQVAREYTLPDPVPGPEAYRLALTPQGGALLGADERGLGWATQTLLELATHAPQRGSVPACRVADAPYKPRRGVHLYLPSRDHLPFFKRLVAGGLDPLQTQHPLPRGGRWHAPGAPSRDQHRLGALRPYRADSRSPSRGASGPLSGFHPHRAGRWPGIGARGGAPAGAVLHRLRGGGDPRDPVPLPRVPYPGRPSSPGRVARNPLARCVLPGQRGSLSAALRDNGGIPRSLHPPPCPPRPRRVAGRRPVPALPGSHCRTLRPGRVAPPSLFARTRGGHGPVGRSPDLLPQPPAPQHARQRRHLVRFPLYRWLPAGAGPRGPGYIDAQLVLGPAPSGGRPRPARRGIASVGLCPALRQFPPRPIPRLGRAQRARRRIRGRDVQLGRGRRREPGGRRVGPVSLGGESVVVAHLA